MAWAEPATEITPRFRRFVANRHAAQMGADADHHQPLFLARLHPGGIEGRIGQGILRDALRGFDLIGRTAADEHRFAAPNHRNGLPRLNGGEVDRSRRKRQHVGGRVHAINQRPGNRTNPDRGTCTSDEFQEVPFGDVAAVVSSFSRGHRIGHQFPRSTRSRAGSCKRAVSGSRHICTGRQANSGPDVV